MIYEVENFNLLDASYIFEDVSYKQEGSMSDVHVHVHILTAEKEVRMLILPIEMNMKLQDIASTLENTARRLRDFPTEATLADWKEALENEENNW